MYDAQPVEMLNGYKLWDKRSALDWTAIWNIGDAYKLSGNKA
jgi:hypothetical protein